MDFEWSELSEIQIKGSELNCIPDMILTLLSFYPPLGGTFGFNLLSFYKY